MSDPKTDSYDQIFKSTSIIGGAAGISLLLGLVRVKFAALLIGPVGVGLMGAYQAIHGLVGAVAGLGIKQSAVRDIADALGKDDDEAVGRIILSLRRICWITGVIGMMAMVALAMPLSRYTFGTAEYTLDIALLGPIILFMNLQGGQSAVLQGMRRIGDLARLNIVGAAAGTFVSIALYSWLGLRGIIPSLLLMALIQLVSTWYFSRQVTVPKVQLTWIETFRTANTMIRLGLVFMSNGLLAALVIFLTRSWISQELDLVAVGIFVAAFSLSGMFVNFILDAMAADYYPRLTAISRDHNAMRLLVNEQAEVGLLLAVPGLLATLSLSPWIILVFFSSEFLPAAALLQWFVLGCLGRVISWPLAMVMLALAKSRSFFLTETSASLLHLGIIWIGLEFYGLEGVAIAFFSLYLFYFALVYGLARYFIAFRWESATARLFCIFLPIVAGTFIAARLLPLPLATGVGLFMTTITTIYCCRGLLQRLGDNNKLVQIAFQIPGLRWLSRL